MLPHSHTLGFLGAGNMAEAIVRGLIARGVEPSRVMLSDVRGERVQALADELQTVPARDNREVMERCDVVVLAVKPQGVTELLDGLREEVREEQLFVSILAGTSARRIESLLQHPGCLRPRLVRVMPNTPALVGAGVSGISPGAHATRDDLELVQGIFEAVGLAEIVDPEMMDAVTGLTGSGPAYIFRMIEALVEAGVAQGFDREQSSRLVKQMVYGAARMALESEHEPAELRRRVTSPGGTTAAGLQVMEEADFSALIHRVVDAATQRSVELGRA